MTSDLATSAKSDVSMARWVAMIAGLLGFVMAVATPLLPVTQTTATLSWPQQGQVGNVTAPLISQAPVDLRATVPCQVVDSMPGDGGLVLGTAPEQGRDAALNAMLADGDIPQRSIDDDTAHRAILEELDDVAAGNGLAEPTNGRG